MTGLICVCCGDYITDWPRQCRKCHCATCLTCLDLDGYCMDCTDEVIEEEDTMRLTTPTPKMPGEELDVEYCLLCGTDTHGIPMTEFRCWWHVRRDMDFPCAECGQTICGDSWAYGERTGSDKCPEFRDYCEQCAEEKFGEVRVEE